MKTIVPDYYTRFSCLMGDCRHSCCIGWEIDIDAEMLDYYRNLKGEIGNRLRNNISTSEESACFRLAEDERCPFLRKDGLCDLILELGEDSLCQICADHPRYRNFFYDREEIGLGLCCEAAADLILKHEEPVRFIVLEDDGFDEDPEDEEAELLRLRGELIGIVQNRRLPLAERIDQMLERCSLPYPISFDDEWAEFFLALERLDESWTAQLLSLKRPACEMLGRAWDLPFEQLMVYLLHRHLPGALEDGDLSGRIAFARLIADLLKNLCLRKEDASIDDLCEFSRMFSSEIEYSDENIEAILEHLHARYPGL